MKMKKLAAGLTALALSVTSLVTPLSENFSGILDGLFDKISYSALALETYGDYECLVLDNDTIKIIDYTGSDTEITIPDTIDGKSVTIIGSYAFEGCSNLTSISMPNSTREIGDYAFSGCSSLTSITLPGNVTSIGGEIFNNCNSLLSINVSNENYKFSSYDGSLYNKNKTKLICCPIGKTSNEIAESVTTIGIGAFSNCSNLVSIIIPGSVTTIGERAFYNCSSLESITIPNSVKTIYDYTFYNCSSLTNVTIPDSVTSIRNDAFRYCSSLTNVTIPDSVTSIGVSAFAYCSSLKSITIPDSVQLMVDNVFDYSDDVTIYCYENSFAHKFAMDNYINYVLVSPVVSNVTGLKMTSNAPTSISMSWNKVPNATGYVVYQAINGKWERIKVTSGNTLAVSGLKSGTNYRFTVKAYKTVSGKNYYSPSYTGVWMTTTPAKPSAKMTVNTPQAIRLEWGKVTGATGYVVYQQVNGAWVKKATTTNNVYVATGLKSGTNYNFAVRAYRTFNGKNYYSPFATSTDTIKTCTKPATVNFTLTAGTKKATVNWSKVTGATGYIVYYKTSANGSWQKLTTTTGTSFTKTGLTSGKTYYFTVKAYKTYNGKTYNASFTTKSVKVK